MDCFSIARRKKLGYYKLFLFHDCKCGLPTIICRASPFLKHKYVAGNDPKHLLIDFYCFFDLANCYIREHVLPKEGKVKYPWINFSKLNRQVSNGVSYSVYRESQTKVPCNHDQDGLETHPEYPDPDESGSQLKENPEQGKTSVNPEPSEQLSLTTLEPQPEESPEQGIIVIKP